MKGFFLLLLLLSFSLILSFYRSGGRRSRGDKASRWKRCRWKEEEKKIKQLVLGRVPYPSSSSSSSSPFAPVLCGWIYSGASCLVHQAGGGNGRHVNTTVGLLLSFLFCRPFSLFFYEAAPQSFFFFPLILPSRAGRHIAHPALIPGRKNKFLFIDDDHNKSGTGSSSIYFSSFLETFK